MSAQIPIVSFAPFLTGDKASQQRVAQEVYEAFSTIGFVYLKDHGIPLSAVDSIFAESARFFALPKSTKTQYALRDASVNQGYTADGAEGIGDHKECYEHRRINELCPDDKVLPDFQHAASVLAYDVEDLCLGEGVNFHLSLIHQVRQVPLRRELVAVGVRGHLEVGDAILVEEYIYSNTLEMVILPIGFKPFAVELDDHGARCSAAHPRAP